MTQFKAGYLPVFSFLVMLMLLLQGCSSNSKRAVAPVPVEDRTVEASNEPGKQAELETPGPSEMSVGQPGRRAPQPGEPVLAMMSEADNYLNAGDNGSAAATIERALRLEPKSARLWHKLGIIRMKEKNYQQAINLARKSNSLAAGDIKLQIENWRLIASANAAAGEADAAAQARARLKQLESRK